MGRTAQLQTMQQRPQLSPMISQIHHTIFPSSFLAHDCVWARLLWFFGKEASTSTPPPSDLWLPWNKWLTPRTISATSILLALAGGVLILASTIPFWRQDIDSKSRKNSIELKERMFLSGLFFEVWNSQYWWYSIWLLSWIEGIRSSQEFKDWSVPKMVWSRNGDFRIVMMDW